MAVPARTLDLAQHALGALVPAMTEAELSDLVASVRKHGVQEPCILLLDGQVLDGWHRYRAAVEADARVETEDYLGDDPLGVVMRANAVRRHLTPQQRADLFVAARKALEDAGARRRDANRPAREVGRNRPTSAGAESEVGRFLPTSITTPSNREGAAAVGVSHDTVNRAEERLQAKSDPDADAATRDAAAALKPKRPSKTEQLQAEIEQLNQDVTLWRQRAEAAESKARLLEEQASPNAQARLAEWNNQRAEIQGLKAELATQRTRYEDTIRRLRAEIRDLKR